MERITHDRLVLYFEECYFDGYEKSVDAKCYVLYDELEREYFICGSRLTSDEEYYGDFKFYCKSKKDVLDYLSFILNVNESNINYGLYNFEDLFDTHEMVDFYVLDECMDENSEIAVYLDMKFKYNRVKKLLRLLKKVRY